MEDRNPAYEPANSGNQAINMNQIEDYDYLWNHDDYDNMGQWCGFKKCPTFLFTSTQLHIRKPVDMDNDMAWLAFIRPIEIFFDKILVLLCVLLFCFKHLLQLDLEYTSAGQYNQYRISIAFNRISLLQNKNYTLQN